MNSEDVENKVQEEPPRPSTRLLASNPAWLQRASEEDREHYFDLEQAVLKSEQALDNLLKEVKSLREFANYYAKEIVRIPSGKIVDPEKIFVTARHTFYIGQQKVVQRNRLTLPEFMINGTYDAASTPLEVALEGDSLPPEFTVEDLVDLMRGDANMRALYSKKFEEKYAREEVLSALQARLNCRIVLSSFSAKLQEHISDQSVKIVELATGEAKGYSPGALSFDGWNKPFQGIIVYCGPQGEAGPCVLYAPEGPGGRTWYEFRSFRQLNIHMVDWVGSPVGRSYLSRQSYASERKVVEDYMRRVLELPSRWYGISHHPWTSPAGALRPAVALTVEWLRDEMEALSPAGYRSAGAHYQKYFARLNTELKGLTQLASHETGLITYEKFAFNLIKKRVEDLLAANGEHVSINPDLIMVQLDAKRSMTLTQLIIKEHHITEDGRPEQISNGYPLVRLLPGHPPISDLPRKYIPGWSRTLRPGEKYIDMLKSDYLDKDSPRYDFRRDVYVNLQLHEMHRGALAEMFNGNLGQGQYARIQQAIEAQRKPETRIPLTFDYPDLIKRNGVYAFHVKSRRIQGVYVFRTKANGVAHDLLYTPHAPDDRWFRPLTEFAKSVKNGGLADYYCKRAKFTDQKVVKTYLDRVENRSVDEAPPVLQIDSRVFDFSDCYRDMINQVIDDVDAKTSSLIEVIAKITYDAAVAAVSVIGCVFPPIGLGLSAIIVAKGVFEGASAFRDGDYEKLLSSYLDCMLELATMRIGKLGFSQTQKLIAKQLGDVNTCMSVVSACTGTTADLAVITELMKEAIAEPDSSEQTFLA